MQSREMDSFLRLLLSQSNVLQCLIFLLFVNPKSMFIDWKHVFLNKFTSIEKHFNKIK